MSGKDFWKLAGRFGSRTRERVSQATAADRRASNDQQIAPGGFEPPFSDPKTDVLPLDEGADAMN